MKDSHESFMEHISSIAKKKSKENNQPMAYDIYKGWVPADPTIEDTLKSYTYDELEKMPENRKLAILRLMLHLKANKAGKLSVVFGITFIIGISCLLLCSRTEFFIFFVGLTAYSFFSLIIFLLKETKLTAYDQGYIDAYNDMQYHIDDVALNYHIQH